MQEEEATLGQEVIGLLQTDTGLRPPATELRQQAMGLPPQVVPLVTEQPLEECQRDTGRLHQVVPLDTGRPRRGEEALATQPRVTVMAAAVVVGEGQLLLMIPPSMFTNSSRPPLQVKTFQRATENFDIQEGPSMVGWRHCFRLEVSPFSPPSPSSPSSQSSPPRPSSLAAGAGRLLEA